MIKLEDCGGCHDDFYNGRNELGVKRCWHASDAKMRTRFRIHHDAMPASPGAFTEMRVPSCYRQQGFSFYNELPDFVPASAVVRRRR